MKSKPINVQSAMAELLSCSPAVLEKKQVITLTFRLGKSFHPVNISIPTYQAERLIEDVSFLIEDDQAKVPYRAKWCRFRARFREILSGIFTGKK